MAYFLMKCWHEKLFYLSHANANSYKAALPIELIEISCDNCEWVSDLRSSVYADQFQKQLSQGDFGYYACLDGKPVGYGWVKHAGSDDYFFLISAGCCYLCRFFVCESMRGNGIYPALISALIEHESGCKDFYIAVEQANEASARGLTKVGFRFIKEFCFLRGLRYTFNKKMLKMRGEDDIK